MSFIRKSRDFTATPDNADELNHHIIFRLLESRRKMMPVQKQQKNMYHNVAEKNNRKNYRFEISRKYGQLSKDVAGEDI